MAGRDRRWTKLEAWAVDQHSPALQASVRAAVFAALDRLENTRIISAQDIGRLNRAREVALEVLAADLMRMAQSLAQAVLSKDQGPGAHELASRLLATFPAQD